MSKGLVELIQQGIREADGIVAEAKDPQLTDVGKFVAQCASVINMQLIAREVKFDFSERGLEIFNPKKANQVH
ncbi:MAG: hypothetical protein EHM34_06930 [Nitrosopumilales archaeon]|nr:MAG: hypothetical protein EHM34_06930 [Nitrosopumilales archaeon]